jgi:hypothetical protein
VDDVCMSTAQSFSRSIAQRVMMLLLKIGMTTLRIIPRDVIVALSQQNKTDQSYCMYL